MSGASSTIETVTPPTAPVAERPYILPAGSEEWAAPHATFDQLQSEFDLNLNPERFPGPACSECLHCLHLVHAIHHPRHPHGH